MVLLIISLLIIGSIISGFLGRLIGYNYVKYIATILITISFILSLILYYNIMINHIIYSIDLGYWIKIDNININWGFLIDELSISLVVLICLISTLVHLYSISYMSHDLYQLRFFSMLSLFTGFMLVLVTGNNYLVLFVGWELIGVSSYMLISHWYTIINPIKSGLSSLLINKVGDTFLTLGIILLLITFGSLNYSVIFSLSQYINVNIINLIMFSLLIGPMTKSPQIGLHIWLLYSMSGLTLVSSMLHSCCLVCPGVYLLLRSCYLLEYSLLILLLILWIGGITTLIPGICPIVLNDIKKIIPLSTMSQLGLMFVPIGISNYNPSLFHLFTHPSFKPLLFISPGSIIHSIVMEWQDIRNYGGLLNYILITYVCILIGSLSLMPILGLSGFYSKDIIIESNYGIYNISGYIIYWFCLISPTLTTIYSLRLIYLIFYNILNINKYSFNIINETNYYLLILMIILSIISIFIGYLTKDIYLGLGNNINSLFTHLNNNILIETEFNLLILIKLLLLILSIIGILVVLIIYELLYKYILSYNNKIYRDYYKYTNGKLLLDNIFNNNIIRIFLHLGYKLNLYLDRGLLYIYGLIGIYNGLNELSYKIISISSNNIKIDNNLQYKSIIRHYNIYLLLIIIIIILFIILSIFINIKFLFYLFLIFIIPSAPIT